MDPIKKAKRRNNKKQAIIHCAMGLIAESGIDSVTTVELAHRLTLTPGALYRYFDSKDHILGAVQLEVIHGLSESLQSTADALAGFQPLAQVVGLLEAYRMFESHRPARYRVLSYFLSTPDQVLPDDIAQSVVEPTRVLFRVLASALAGAGESKELSSGEDPVLGAMILWSAIHGVLERKKMVRMGLFFDIDKFFESTARAVLLGWGASAEQLDDIYTRQMPALRETCLQNLGGSDDNL